VRFGEFVRKLRLERGLSQRQLAEYAKLSNAEISRLENGERQKPSVVTIRAIAPYLGVDYKELLLQAGYIDNIESSRMGSKTYLDSKGKPMDIVHLAKSIYKIDPDLIESFHQAVEKAPKKDIEMIKKLLSIFSNDRLNSGEKVAVFTVLDKFMV